MISRRIFSIVLVVACAVSAGAGTGATLLIAERGPAGPRGEVGPEGPAGDGADEALYRVDEVEGDLDGAAEELEDAIRSIDGRLSEIEFDVVTTSELSALESDIRTICRALDLYC